MYLIRVTGKAQRVDTEMQAQFPSLDFGFQDLLIAIGSYVTELYWAHSGIIYSFPESLTKEDYESINSSIQEYTLQSDPMSGIQYMHRGYIEKFGRYIYSDSLDLAGYQDIESLKSFESDIRDRNNTNAYVHFRCSDAVSWEIYSRNLNIIMLVEDTFRFTETFGTGV